MENKFINADCMNPETGLPSYPDNYFDLAIVDPPYGIGEDGRRAKSRSNGDRQVYRKDKGQLIKIPQNINYKVSEWDNKQPEQRYFDELFRVSKKCVIWGCNYLTFAQKGQSSGRIIWDKVNSGDFSDCEIAWTNLFSSVRQIEYMWNGMLQGESLRQGRRAQGNTKLKEKRIHPTQKPRLLYYWILDKYAKEGSLILDTHVGSASSLIACEKKGFNYVGFELDEDYYKAAASRMTNELKPTLF